MKWKFQTAGRLLALLALSGALLAAPLPAQAAPGVLTGLTGTGSKLELELTEMELEITDDDPRPKGYLYTSGQSDYYFIVWMSSNSNVATVDGDGKVTGRNAGTAIITAISDHGSNSCGIRQELLANLQTPLRDRKRIVNQIIDNYYEARAIGHLTDPEGQQPVMPILEACYDASARSVKANENRYSIGSIENYLDDAEKPAEG